MKQHFTEAQIVEMTWRTALCGAFNRFNDILQLDIDKEGKVTGVTVIGPAGHGFDEAATDAAKKFLFQPARRGTTRGSSRDA